MDTKDIINSLNCFIDLHLHLDGSISLKSARELAKIENVDLPESDNKLKKLLRVSPDCRNLNEYLEKFELTCRLMQSEKSVFLAVYNLCNELKELGYIYAEIRFAPQKHCEKHMTQKQAVEAAIEGIKKSGFNAQLILCCMRDGRDNSCENIETVNITAEYLGKGVCACDLAGAEALFPNENYGYIFEIARGLNIPFTIHSGEALGAESIELALDMGAKRIGHGVRSAENIKVAKRLAENKVPIEVCPTSNVNTCVYEKISDVPIKYLMDMGVIVTVNSDNMSVSDTDVKKELCKIGFGIADIKKLILNSAQSAFADEDTKNMLKSIINKDFAGKNVD